MANRKFSQLEGTCIEYKLRIPETAQLARLLVAMANTKGGEVIIGVREGTREVIGVSPHQRVEEHIANVAAEVCTPQIPIELSYETVESGATVLIIQVGAGYAKPYYVKKLGLTKGTFVRIGSTCRLADREMLQRLTREGKNQTFDDELSNLSTGYIDERLFEDYLQRRNERLGAPKSQLRDSILEDLQVARGKKLTVAGALLFTEAPHLAHGLSGAYIRAAKFLGDTVGEFVDQQDITGPLAQQIDEAVKFLIRNTKHKLVRSSGVKRADSSEYTSLVLREIVTNAVVHRDYSLAEEHIRISVFDDRIEVVSPGPLPGTITPANMIHRQRSRNPVIAKRMFEMGYIEGWGLGIDTLVSWAEANQRRMPVFSDEHGDLTATIFSSPRIRKDTTVLSLREEQVLESLQIQESISNQELRELYGYTKTQAQSVLRQLCTKKILVAKGKGRAVRYRLREREKIKP